MLNAFHPHYGTTGYETGDWITGCYYDKCAIGYAWVVSNITCDKGHYNTGRHASGYPSCPHGYYTGMQEWIAHCRNDSGWDKLGYRAPCGRTTRMEGEQWGYVTRTHTDVTALPLTTGYINIQQRYTDRDVSIGVSHRSTHIHYSSDRHRIHFT